MSTMLSMSSYAQRLCQLNNLQGERTTCPSRIPGVEDRMSGTLILTRFCLAGLYLELDLS